MQKQAVFKVIIFCIIVTPFITVQISAAVNAPAEWNNIEAGIRGRILAKNAAEADMKRLRPLLDGYYEEKGCVIEPYAGVFPVAGYGLSDADMKGYVDEGYDFFSGIRHADHPAVDIFIFDRNHDCLDDRTKKPVDVLSMSPGIVVSVYTGWEPGNALRGGNSIYIYDPVSKGLFYYAHQASVMVSVGEIVKPGDIIGTVGRTGVHAYAKRSPTHLHVMYLKYPENGYPVPENVSGRLIAAKKGKTIPVYKIAKVNAGN
jgi:murein DD-endopeptidase MepM/ murein hydrolase activator NlpD